METELVSKRDLQRAMKDKKVFVNLEGIEVEIPQKEAHFIREVSFGDVGWTSDEFSITLYPHSTEHFGVTGNFHQTPL